MIKHLRRFLITIILFSLWTAICYGIFMLVVNLFKLFLSNTTAYIVGMSFLFLLLIFIRELFRKDDD